MTVSSAVKNRLDNLGEGKQSLLTFTGIEPSGGRQSMPLDRVPGEQFDVLVDDADGRAGNPCSRGSTPLRVIYNEGLSCRPPDARAARRPSAPPTYP